MMIKDFYYTYQLEAESQIALVVDGSALSV